MNEKLDLVQILKDCPLGTKFYSPLFGEVLLRRIKQDVDGYVIAAKTARTQVDCSFTADGRYYESEIDGECMLFPSKDCRDWAQFKQPQPTQFAKGDHIVWRGDDGEFLGVFAEYSESGKSKVVIFHGERSALVEVYTNDLTKLEKFDKKLLKAGDAVLARDGDLGEWSYTLFSHLRKGEHAFCASCCAWRQCVPYNQETQYMLGKCCKEPKFYNLTEENYAEDNV